MGYFEDFAVGDRLVTAGTTFTEADVIDFGWRYDPQPFHIDRVAAETGPFGGLIASGFHTLSRTFRLIVQSGWLDGGSMGSPGFDELRWYAPVRPGDTLHVEAEVLEVRASRSKPDRGMVRVRYAALNQRGEEVMSYEAMQLMRRRPDGDEAGAA